MSVDLFIRLGLVAASDEDLFHHQLPPGLPLSSAYLHTACPPVRVFEDSPQQSVAITVNCYTVTVPQQSVAVTVDAKVSSVEGDAGVKVAMIGGGRAVPQQLPRFKLASHVAVLG